MAFDEHTERTQRKGVLAAAGGGLLLAGGLFLSLACCWAPALLVGLGLTTIFGALHGFRLLFIALGSLLIVGGLGWALYSRRQGRCESCE